MASDIKGISGASGQIPVPPSGIASKRATQTANGKQADRVSITSMAASLGNIEHTLAQIPVVDGALVDGVREALADGSYEVDPYRIADKLIEMELLLGARPQEDAKD